MRTNVSQGRLDRAVAVLKEAHEAGFDPFDAIEHDPEAGQAPRVQAGYQDLVEGIDAENLAMARSRVKEEFARTHDFVFDFNVKDLDGKPLSLATSSRARSCWLTSGARGASRAARRSPA